MSTSNFRMLRFATPVIRVVVATEQPSHRAWTTATRCWIASFRIDIKYPLKTIDARHFDIDGYYLTMKKGRPPKPKKDRRSHILRVCLSDAEHRLITGAADKAGRDASGWAREHLLKLADALAGSKMG